MLSTCADAGGEDEVYAFIIKFGKVGRAALADLGRGGNGDSSFVDACFETPPDEAAQSPATRKKKFLRQCASASTVLGCADCLGQKRRPS
ncbi:hypothetical protein EFV68_05770 [Yersinia enterocolitica]|nr:hypothetical protein [Yersinia enterocolitica]